MGKLERLLEQRQGVIDQLREVCMSLHEVGIGYDEYIKAFVDEASPLQAEIKAKQAEEQVKLEYLELMKKTSAVDRVDLKDVELMDEEWPLKRFWVQVMLFKLRNVLLARASRPVQKVIEDLMREGKPKMISKKWLLGWLNRNFPLRQVPVGENEAIRMESSLTSMNWGEWKLILLRWKLSALDYLYGNREWLLRFVDGTMPIRTSHTTVKFGKYKKFADDVASYSLETDDTGGFDLMQELGARTISPRPVSAIAIDLVLQIENKNNTVLNSSKNGDENSEEEESSESEDDDTGGSLSMKDFYHAACEYIDIVVEDELDQVPGFICAKCTKPANALGVLRLVAYFSTYVDETFWISRIRAKLTLWPPVESARDWILLPHFTFKGLEIDTEVTYRQPACSLFQLDSVLEFDTIKEMPNPLNRLYQLFLTDQGASSTRGDVLLGKLLESVLSGKIEKLSQIRMCSANRKLVLKPLS